MTRFWRFMATYACGFAEGSVMIAAGRDHWAWWPGVVWLTLPMVVATFIYATAVDRP